MSNDLTPKSNTNIDVFKPNENEELLFDVNYARSNIQVLIETGIEGARQLADIADQSQNSLCYERLSVMLKTVSDLNKDLIDVAKKKADVARPVVQEQQGGVTNQLFVGSTADMAAILAQLNKNKND